MAEIQSSEYGFKIQSVLVRTFRPGVTHPRRIKTVGVDFRRVRVPHDDRKNVLGVR